MAIKCKRIKDGKTYNTETATQLAGWDDDEGPFLYGQYLYQNRFGAFVTTQVVLDSSRKAQGFGEV